MAQINVYTWILAQHGIAIHTGEIVYFDMGGMIRAPVEIWPVTRTAELVEGAYNALLVEDLPEMITDPEEQWQCNFCPVRRICEGQSSSLAKAA